MPKNHLRSAAFLVLLLITGIAAQESNLMWLSDFIRFSELPILQANLANYSENDLLEFREKFKAVQSATGKSNWEGRFAPGGPSEVGISLLSLSFESGFASLYIYTCLPELRAIDYGSVVNGSDTVELISEVKSGSPRKATHQKFVKVQWGDRFYLVEESSLAEWAEKAAGVYTTSETDEHSWLNFWVKGDFDNEPAGVPEFPARFKHLRREPIKASITAVSARKIKSEVTLANSNYSGDSAVYAVKINAGSSLGVKKGMVFRIPHSNEELEITEVFRNSSLGLVVRAIDEETRLDHCLSDTLDPTPVKCPKITTGSAVSTITGKFWL